MFDKKFKIVFFLGVAIILLILFGKKILNTIGVSDQLSTFTEPTSMTYYKKSCAYGNSTVCNEIGDMYHYGSDIISSDYAEAVEYYKRSCELKDGKGCNNLAYMLNHGKGIKHNNWKAIRLYKKACNKYKEIEACYNVGSMYYNAEGTKKSYSQAAAYFKESCNDNRDIRIGAACNNLGYMYEHGKYFRKNISKALAYYITACVRLNEASACNNIAYFYEKRGNVVTARTYYEKGCRLKDEHSCNKIEDVLRDKINLIKGDDALAEAINICNRSSKGGKMCYRVGLHYEKIYKESNDKDDQNKARNFLEKACNRQESQSCKHLGDLHR